MAVAVQALVVSWPPSVVLKVRSGVEALSCAEESSLCEILVWPVSSAYQIRKKIEGLYGDLPLTAAEVYCTQDCVSSC